MQPSGLLNLNKPPGVTSRWLVDQVQRLVRPLKTGHAGTLDPLATGVVVVCVGAATRLIQYVQRKPKSYRATFLLGRWSDTEDVEGQVVPLENPPVPTTAQLAQAALALTGEIQQRPPAFSALKLQGQRAYKLARRGEAVELAPRPVTVHRLEIVRYEYPELELSIGCGSGTYVRSLGRDLAASLGTAAVMSALTRTAIGGFTLAEAWAATNLEPNNWIGRLLPPSRAVEELPAVGLGDADCRRLWQGQQVACGGFNWPEHVELAVIDPHGRMVAIAVCALGHLRTTCCFPPD